MRRIVAASMMAFALLTSCSADADPQTAPTTNSESAPLSTTPTSEPTDEPSTGPVEPPLPAAAKAPTRAGAEAFVRYYIDLLNYAGATGDTDAFLAAAEGCNSCRGLARNFQRTYQRGGFYKTRGWLVNALFASQQAGTAFTAVAEVRETAITWRETSGSRLRRLPPGTVNLRFSLFRERSRWFIREFTRS